MFHTRILAIHQKDIFSRLESIHYIPNQKTFVAITKDTGKETDGSTYRQGFGILGARKPHYDFPIEKIFNIHVESNDELKICEEKLKQNNSECLYKNTPDFKGENKSWYFMSLQNSSTKPENRKVSAEEKIPAFQEVVLEVPAKAELFSPPSKSLNVPESKNSYGFNYNMEDVEAGLIENFVQCGDHPVPVRLRNPQIEKPLKLQRVPLATIIEENKKAETTTTREENSSTSSNMKYVGLAALGIFAAVAMKTNMLEIVSNEVRKRFGS